MSGCWYLMTADTRDTAAEVVADAVRYADGQLNLQVMLDRERRGLAAMMQEAYEASPGLDFYGWLADDTYPRTPGWNLKLEAAAQAQGFACANDGGYIDRDAIRGGSDLSSGLVWAGWLLRAVGWWAAPGLREAWVDVAWLEILRPLGLIAYLDNVLVEHRHWRTGKRAQDSLDDLAAEGVERDRQAFYQLQQRELGEARRRVAERLTQVDSVPIMGT